MSEGEAPLRDTFKVFRDTGESIKKALILQVFDNEDGSIELSDGRNRIHFGYGREEATRDSLLDSLIEGGFEEEHLDGSHFSFGEVSFDYFWDTRKKELIVSLVSSHVRLIDSGIGHRKPSRTFYITLELSLRRLEILKREAMSKTIKNKAPNIDFGEMLAEMKFAHAAAAKSLSIVMGFKRPTRGR